MPANIRTSAPRATASDLDLEEEGTEIAVMIVSMPTNGLMFQYPETFSMKVHDFLLP